MRKQASKIKPGQQAQVPTGADGFTWITVESAENTTDFQEKPITKLDGVDATDNPVSWFGAQSTKLEVRTEG